MPGAFTKVSLAAVEYAAPTNGFGTVGKRTSRASRWAEGTGVKRRRQRGPRVLSVLTPGGGVSGALLVGPVGQRDAKRSRLTGGAGGSRP